LYGYEPGFFKIQIKGEALSYKARASARAQRKDRAVGAAMDPKWIVRGVAPLAPDPWHPQSIADAVRNRLAVKLPEVTVPNFYPRLRSFARLFFKRHFQPVDPSCYLDDDTLFQDWLASRASYSQARKTDLKVKWQGIFGKLRKKDYENQTFVKRETYPEPKWPRAICSRSDLYKCFSGPWISLIEAATYISPMFVKHVPVPQRGDFVERLAQHDVRILASDFSSFELHAHRQVQLAVEQQFYKYMLQYIPQAAHFLEVHRSVCTRKQTLVNKFWKFIIPACRMSGETSTSLGNGITNLVLIHFITELYGGKVLDAVVEGDDGLYAIKGHAPTVRECASCGTNVKLSLCENLDTAGFCSMVFARTGMARVPLRDFREKLVKFGWTLSDFRFSSERVKSSLLRAAGLALAYENNACPVLWKVAECVLRDTVGVVPRFVEDGYHQAPDIRNLQLQEPTADVRAVYAELYDISVGEQIALEHEIERCGLLGPMLFDFVQTDARCKMWENVRVRSMACPHQVVEGPRDS